jgi:hypothetical protein
VTINASFADEADAARMEIGKTVRLVGTFRVVRRSTGVFIAAANARILETDPALEQSKIAMANLLLCQAPQLADLSRQVDQQLCVQSDLLSNLNVMRPQLEAAVHALTAHTAGQSNDPNAITCHKRIYERLPSSVTCGFNSFWKSWVSAGPSFSGPPSVRSDYGTSDNNVMPAFIGGAIWNR